MSKTVNIDEIKSINDKLLDIIEVDPKQLAESGIYVESVSIHLSADKYPRIDIKSVKIDKEKGKIISNTEETKILYEIKE